MKIIQIETVGRLYQQNFHAIAIREHIKHCQRHNILVGFEIFVVRCLSLGAVSGNWRAGVYIK
jgi:hypothetical protein